MLNKNFLSIDCELFSQFLLFLINSSIDLNKVLVFKVLRILALVTVSGNPPLLVIITAHPLEDASRLVLPNGSSQREHTTAILVFL